MNKLLLAVLCSAVLSAQDVQEFADDNAFAEAMDLRQLAGPAPDERGTAARSGWCLSYRLWGNNATLWHPLKSTRIELVHKHITRAQISDDGSWAAVASRDVLALFHVRDGTATRVLSLGQTEWAMTEDGSVLVACVDGSFKAWRLADGKATSLAAEWPAKPGSIVRSGAPGTMVAQVDETLQYWKLTDGAWRTTATVPTGDWTTPACLDPGLRFSVLHEMMDRSLTVTWLKNGRPDGEARPTGLHGRCVLSGDLLASLDDGVLRMSHVDAVARTVTEVARISVDLGVSDLCFFEGKVGLLGASGFWTWAGKGGDASASIGGDAVRWTSQAQEFAPANFPVIEWGVRFQAARTDATFIELSLVAHNVGGAPQARLVAEMEYSGAAGGPARVYIGEVRPGAQVKRRVRLPLGSSARPGAVRLLPRQLGARTWPAREWQYLPMTARNAEELSALALKIHNEAHRVLSELTGRKIEARLEQMPAGFLGFVAGRDAKGNPRVGYMNMWSTTEAGQASIMVLMHIDNLDEAFRNMEALTWSYLCHEAVHIARANERPAWNEEYIANMIQPWLLRRVIENLKAPCSAADIERLFERIATRYRASLPEGTVLPVDRFIARDGTGECFDINPWELFLSDTGAYIYFGARINAHSISLETSLEKLCDKYLKQPAKKDD